jgi:hypothetical protein
LLGLSVRQRTRVLIDLRRRQRGAAVRADSINDAAGATGNEKISLTVESNPIGSSGPGSKGLRRARLRRVEVSIAHAHDFAERADADK